MTQSQKDEIDFTALPKIELHAHLSGSISRQCLHEIWLKKKAEGKTDLEDPLVVMPEGKHDYDLKTFFPLFSTYTYRLIDDAWSLRYSTLSVLRDFAADGVVYLELRTTPREMPAAGLDKEDYVRLVLDTISQYEAAEPPASGPGMMHTRLILSVDRRNTLPEAQHVLSLAEKFHSPDDRNVNVVALDLCGDPSAPDIYKFAPVLDSRAPRRRLIPTLKTTLHFAEAECSSSDAELSTLLSWQPDRIGHVIHISQTIREAIVARGGGTDEKRPYGLELCLSCNVHAGMISGGFEEHHFGEWWQEKDCVVVICTDDVGVFGSKLSNEYALVAHHFGLGRAEICALARRGIDVIFAGEDEKARLREIMWT
ncbi:adenosine deaminase [Echria macrotheca]|uniref:Adenosine deaminase n=1 Tax=Echria macrotheca TaxID=438768 RepID=A0AAJ0B829_9PEZI|nr:adenosine deaminase [Echria macrotheca]